MTGQPARSMHRGQIWHEHDWDLTVTAVDVTGDQVAFAVDEFPDTLMHRDGAAVLDLTEPQSTPMRLRDGWIADDAAVRIGGQPYAAEDVPAVEDTL